MSAQDPDRDRLAQLRELLPATGAGIYLDTGTRGPLPAETAAAMREADDWELAVGRVWEGRDDDVIQRHEEARAVLAALLGADPAAIVLTHGRTDALALAMRCVAGPGRVVIDATSFVGAKAVSVDELGADAVALACDRWLLGPEATGALWLANPALCPGQAELSRTSLIGLARSVGWLEMYVGLEWTFERTARLANWLYDALAAVAGIELVTPRDALVATISFRVANWTAMEAAEELSRRVKALVRPMVDLNAVVASVAWFNTEDELDRFVVGVAELAQYTPATLPRRPNLFVLTDQ